MNLLKRTQPVLFVLTDVVILVVGFLFAFRLRMSTWDVTTLHTGLGPAVAVSVGAYTIALAISGIYKIQPSHMQLTIVWRISAALVAGLAVSVLVTFLISPQQMAPRSVYVVHWMLSQIGILGYRGVFKQFSENRSLMIPQRPELPQIEDVLGQHGVAIDKDEIQHYVSSRTILITGAGGSIGSALSNLCLAHKPYRLVLIDMNEYSLFQLEEEIRQTNFDGDVVLRIADVRDGDIMQSIFESTRPDIVFHAAAYKHVPLMERHPVEAFRNNTLSTVSLVRLCEAFEIEQFIFVSTDKVVEPSSVLGATKRLGEWYTRAADSRIRRKIVRFGNVFASQGSVVEIFARQIASGGPVRITHPEMERYFMSRDDACALILQTMMFDDEFSVYMLRMGEPVSILELAKRMIELYAPVPSDVEVMFIGVRPGEKLQEQLHSADEIPQPTAHDAIVGLSNSALFSRSELDEHIARLEQLSSSNRTAELRKALFEDAWVASTSTDVLTD